MSGQTIYRVQHATSGHLDACLALRIEAEQSLAESGIVQWTNSSVGRDGITSLIETGHMFVVVNMRDEVVACCALSGPDLDFWRPDECVQPALYLYKMMISESCRGTGLGDLLLDWCSQRAQRVGARWLRLDCWKTNEKLKQLWRERGFTHVDTRDAAGRGSGALFQRDAGYQHVSPRQVQDHWVTLADDSDPARPAHEPVTTDGSRDIAGEAAIWRKAADLVRDTQQPGNDSGWNQGLSRAAQTLDHKRRRLRDTTLPI